MCGIFGVIYKKPDKENIEEIEKLVKELFILSESRGKEASGLAVRHENESDDDGLRGLGIRVRQCR